VRTAGAGGRMLVEVNPGRADEQPRTSARGELPPAAEVDIFLDIAHANGIK